MDLSTSVLGTTVSRVLQTRIAATILMIGRDAFTRADLARVECFNFTAAQNLSAILNRELQVPHTQYVFDKVSPNDLALPRLGAISLAVLGAAFEAKKIGGRAPLDAWMLKHLGLNHGTFYTVKGIAHPDDAPRKVARR